jgi:outer membrane protein assembly factor BamA
MRVSGRLLGGHAGLGLIVYNAFLMNNLRRLIELMVVVCCATVATAQMEGRPVTEINIEGLRNSREQKVRAVLVSRVGEPFSEAKVRCDHAQLEHLGLFAAIDVRPEASGDGVALLVQVREIVPYLPLPSLDVSEEDGISVGAGLRALDFLSSGRRLTASVRVGGSTQAEVNTEEPWVKGITWPRRAEYFYRRRTNDLDDFKENSHELNLRLGKMWNTRLGVGGLFSFLSMGADRSEVTLSDGLRDNIPALGVFLGYDDRDSWNDPRRGWWAELETRHSFTLGVESGNWWTTNIDVRRYQPLAGRHTLAVFSLATLQSGTLGRDLPSYMDFHIGGTNSVRGWELDSMRGKHQFLNTLEYRYSLMDPKDFTIKGITAYLGLQLAAFADVGIAWDRSEQFRRGNFLDGYGFGLRLLFPFIKFLRLDLAWGESDGGVRFHVAIDEKAVMQRRRVR